MIQIQYRDSRYDNDDNKDNYDDDGSSNDSSKSKSINPFERKSRGRGIICTQA